MVLGLLAAVGYGASDFMAGVGGRRGPAVLVALAGQPVGLVTAALGLWLVPWSWPQGSTLAWGAASGIGSGLGILALYRGLAIGEMTTVATMAGLLTALIPAVVGLALGERPGPLALLGIGVALPAVAMVSWRRPGSAGSRRGVVEAAVAGSSFALLFIALDRAGTASGTWPLLPGQLVAVVIIASAASRVPHLTREWRRVVPLALGAGALGGVGNILYLTATGSGQLAIVAVITSLYPAVTVILARLALGERWSATQKVGLLVAAASVILIGV